MQLGIRTRAILWLAVLGIAIAAVVYPFGNGLLDANFRDFERQQIEDDADRIRLAISEEAARLRGFAQDYGHWDSALQYLEGDSPEFIADNFYPEALTNIGADFAYMTDSRRRLVWSGMLVRSEDGTIDSDLAPMASSGVEPFMPIDTFAQVRESVGSRTVFIWHQDECYMVAVSSISDGRGETFAGWIAFAKRIDAARRADLTTRTKAQFTLDLVKGNDVEMPRSGALIRVDIGQSSFTARQLLVDDAGAPILAILTEGVRPLAAQQTRARQLLLSAVLFTVLSGLLLTYAIVHVLVIRRVQSLSRWARALRCVDTDAADDGYVARARPDEIDRLHEDFAALTHELRQITEEWKAQAWQDWLTGIGNRARLVHDLSHAVGASRKSPTPAQPDALLLVDMDNFKAVNDLLGHLSGDELLKDVARRIQALAPARATVYRMGGDEFALLWPQAPSLAEVEALACALLGSLRINHGSISVSASIGIVVSSDNAVSAEEALMRADIALYSAKEAGRDLFRHYSREDFERFREQFDLDALLRSALTAGEIDVEFQPIIDPQGGRVVAVEALARWLHPERGAIPPARFVATAERTNMIHQLDGLILRKSCEALVRLRRKFPSLVMNINVSPISLQGDSFLPQLLQLLEDGAVAPGALRIELTEGGVGMSSQALDAAASALRRVGVALVIDDFGAGASSLNRLNRLQPAGLKLDGSFVRDFAGAGGRICRAVIELARELDMSVTAEFVETSAQQRFLTDIGCDYLQGYQFSQSLREDALTDWMLAFETRGLVARVGRASIV